MKRILYFYPHKFSHLTDGIHVRIITILQYFQSRGFVVDFINFENPDIKGCYAQDLGLIDNLFLTEGNPFLPKERGRLRELVATVAGRIDHLKNRVVAKLGVRLRDKKVSLPNFMTPSLEELVRRELKARKYEAVLVTYSYWAGLAKLTKAVSPETRTVIDPTDFLAMQNFYAKNSSFSQVGNMFSDELTRIGWFDAVIHISNDERWLFSSFFPQQQHVFVPQYFEAKTAPEGEKRYDLLFIGSGNPYNQEGLKWFLDEVYPKLDKKMRIGIAGNVSKKTGFEADNVQKLGFVDDAEGLYRVSRFTICPLKRGSGMKIKVIESLSYGLPVVSTFKGLDGFSNKEPSGGVLVTDDPAAYAAHLNRLFGDASWYEQQRQAARDLFARHFSMESNFKQLDTIFN